MENDRLHSKAWWLKYPLLCLLICPLPATAAYNHEAGEKSLIAISQTASNANEKNDVLETQQTGRKRNLTGTVVDDIDGSPVIGANVILKGSKTGTATDLDGRFTLSIPEKGGTIEVSFIGYKKQTLHLTDQGFVNVRMISDNEQLSEVVIVGAGTQKKVSVTGAITTVKGTALTAPSSSLTNNIAGKLPGLISSATSGEPGTTSSFYIRGVSTFGGRATPLILLDGVEVSAADLDRIPSESIETFSLLKDASATAIYGARGANGVMLITTKSGVENQRAVIRVSAEASMQQPMQQIGFVDGATWMELYNEALTTRKPNSSPKYSQEAIDMTRNQTAPYRYPDVDWMGMMFKDRTMNQRANINVTGGGSRITYYMSLQANHDTGMLNVPMTVISTAGTIPSKTILPIS